MPAYRDNPLIRAYEKKWKFGDLVSATLKKLYRMACEIFYYLLALIVYHYIFG